MKSHDRKSGPEDAELLRASLSDVVPLSRSNRAQIPRPRPLPVPTQRLRDEQAALDDSLNGLAPWDSGFETGEELAFLRKGLPSLTLGKLRRGHWVTQDEIDLHGLTSPEARALLREFLACCLRRGLRCVRVIHGKGLRSKNREPVLKHKVAYWLMQREEVLAYCQARRTEGGSGAVMVLLKGGRQKAEDEG